MSHFKHQIGDSQDTNTHTSPGKAVRRIAVVYYDGNCFLCRQLASFIGNLSLGSSIELKSSVKTDPVSLTVEVFDGEQPTQLDGPSAWEWLLVNHNSLKQVNWLAERLGLIKPTARVLSTTGALLRRSIGSFCRRCP